MALSARVATSAVLCAALSAAAAQQHPWTNPFCAQATERNAVTTTLSCENGVIDSITAFFGTPLGSCPTFTRGSCDDAGFQAYAAAACMGKSACTLTSAGTKDPCNDVVKSVRCVGRSWSSLHSFCAHSARRFLLAFSARRCHSKTHSARWLALLPV